MRKLTDSGFGKQEPQKASAAKGRGFHTPGVMQWLGCLMLSLGMVLTSADEGQAQQFGWDSFQKSTFSDLTYTAGIEIATLSLPEPALGMCGNVFFSNTLPPGLTLGKNTGMNVNRCVTWIFGTPREPGEWNMVLEATDDAENYEDSVQFKITVLPGAGGGNAEQDNLRRVLAAARISNLPDLIRFQQVDETSSPPGSSLNFQMSESGGVEMDGSFVKGLAWGELSLSRYKIDDSSYDNRSAALGAHRKMSPRALAGLMLQYDKIDESRTGGAEGKSWMAGPYYVAQPIAQPLFFEGRLLYGRSDNTDSAGGDFDTNIWLAQARMEGQMSLGSNEIVAFPYADISWVRDRLKNDDRVIELGQLTLGSDFEIPVPAQRGEMIFTGGLGLKLIDPQGKGAGNDDAFANPHGQIDIGMDYRVDDSVNITVDGFLDGIGSNFEGYGLSVGARLDF